jgi:hypothetical protein
MGQSISGDTVEDTYTSRGLLVARNIKLDFQAICHLLNDLEFVIFFDSRVLDLQRIVVDMRRQSTLEHSYHFATHLLAILH